MDSQIFKAIYPKEELFDLLDKICEKTDNYYLIDNACYKKMLFHKYEMDFLVTIIEYYHDSKRFYVEREFSYNSFVNIIRQVCKHNEIAYSNKINYNDSQYSIKYYIYHNS